MPGAETHSMVKLPRSGSYELYEYPARALDATASERASKLRMQAVEVDHEGLDGASTVRDLAPGAKLKPFDVADPSNRFETAAIRLTAAQSQMTYAGGNFVLASDAAMILRAGASEIILRPDGEISIKGTLIRVEGDKICLN